MTTNPTLTHGLAAIAETFARAKAEGRATFMPYWMVGYPDLPRSIEAIEALVEAGADAIEIGAPFSDPLADGVVVQAASQVALDQGTRLSDCLDAVKTLRARGVKIPLLLMSYVNPPLAYGLGRYTEDAANVGADGFIIPDLPPEEAHDFLTLCNEHDQALVEFLAPTSSQERIQLVAETARGFIYVVAVTGVTGPRDQLASDLPDFIARVRAVTDVPLSVGFGISRPEHVTRLKQLADGVIVASALLRTFEQSGTAAMLDLARSLRAAC